MFYTRKNYGTGTVTYMIVLKVKELPGNFEHIVSVHNSCHGVRELRLSSPSEEHIPRYNKIIDLLKLKKGITVKEPERF